MAIHFSIGFVVEQRPKKPFESVCAMAMDLGRYEAVACNIQRVEAVAGNIQRVTVIWPRELGECK